MGPLFTQSDEWSFVLALIIGILFGYVLESSGFSTSRKLVGVFYGYDFVVLRVFFTAAVTAAVGLAALEYMGLLNIKEVFINNFFVGPTIVGGIIMGLGFILGGFCPGTSVCAAAIGKIDAMWFLGGILLGSFLFDFGYPLYAEFLLSGDKGSIRIHESVGISFELALLLFVFMAIAAFYVTALIEKKFSDKSQKY
jgi:uncharacterized membrane protein YedE/YeeE